ncbi:MAG: hypothetical protein ACK4E0_16745 [Chitinophagaceae bacterium]
MKKIIIICICLISFGGTAMAQEAGTTVAVVKKQYMQITTVESVVAGGLGRSKMIITNPDGSQKESNLENLFSMAGINFKNIKDNEANILSTLKQYTDAGWKLDQTTSLTLSPGEAGGNGIFMTRYLLSKNE